MNSIKVLMAIALPAWQHLPADRPLGELFELFSMLTSQTVKANCAASVWRELMSVRQELEKSALLIHSAYNQRTRSCVLSAEEIALLPSLIALIPGEREKQLCLPRQVLEPVQVPKRLTDRVKRMVFSFFNWESESTADPQVTYESRVIPPPISWDEMAPGLRRLDEWCIPPGVSPGSELKRLATVARLMEITDYPDNSGPALCALKTRLSEFLELAAGDECGLIQLDMLQ